jgi:hypothetical protein
MKLFRLLPPFSGLAAFNDAARESRIKRIRRFSDLPDSERKRRVSYFSSKRESSLFSDFEIRLMEKVDEYERRAETFLTIASSGGLLFLAQAFQGSTWKLGILVLLGAGLLVAAFVMVSVVKMRQVEIAYFRLGEWHKAQALLAEGKITKAELHFLTHQTHRTPIGLAWTAMLAWAFVIFGFFLLVLGFADLSGLEIHWSTDARQHRQIESPRGLVI